MTTESHGAVLLSAGSEPRPDGYALIPTSNPDGEPQTEDEPTGPKRSVFQLWKDGYFTIVPESGTCLGHVIDYWDIVVIVALMTTAMVVPFEVALIVHTPPALKKLDLVINCIFIWDIVLTFNVAFLVEAGMQSRDHYETAPLKIARNYLAVPFSNGMASGWFWPDVGTIIPWEKVTQTEGARSVRLVRVLRLLRMLRLVRVMKLFKRWHTHFGFSFAMVKISRCVIMTVVFVHWLACVWAHLGANSSLYAGPDEGCWLQMSYLATQKNTADFSPFEVYRLALYFCAVVLTTVGFGDIVPMNQVETTVMIVIVLSTGLVWAWVVANIVDVITHFDVYGMQFNSIMDDLNLFMFNRGVKSSLQYRVRKHLHDAYNVHRQRHHQNSIQWLSDSLQGELAIASGVDKIADCVWYLGVRDKAAWIVDLAQRFQPEIYSPDEYLMQRHQLVIIRKGSCARRGCILVSNSVIGEDMILISDVLRDTCCPRTLTLCEVMQLSRDSLRAVCEKNHELNLRIRRAQIKLALWRGFIHLARKAKRAEAAVKNSNDLQRSHWDKYFTGNVQVAQTKEIAGHGLLEVKKVRGWVESLEDAHVERDHFHNTPRRMISSPPGGASPHHAGQHEARDRAAAPAWTSSALEIRVDALEQRLSTRLDALAGGVEALQKQQLLTNQLLQSRLNIGPDGRQPPEPNRRFQLFGSRPVSSSSGQAASSSGGAAVAG